MDAKPYDVFVFCKALAQSRMPGGVKLLLLMLATNHADSSGTCYPSLGLIASKLGVTRRHVTRLVGEAEDAGWLIAQRGMGRTSSRYALMIGDAERLTGDIHVTSEMTSMSPQRRHPRHLRDDIHVTQTDHRTDQGTAQGTEAPLFPTQNPSSERAYQDLEREIPTKSSWDAQVLGARVHRREDARASEGAHTHTDSGQIQDVNGLQGAGVLEDAQDPLHLEAGEDRAMKDDKAAGGGVGTLARASFFGKEQEQQLQGQAPQLQPQEHNPEPKAQDLQPQDKEQGAPWQGWRSRFGEDPFGLVGKGVLLSRLGAQEQAGSQTANLTPHNPKPSLAAQDQALHAKTSDGSEVARDTLPQSTSQVGGAAAGGVVAGGAVGGLGAAAREDGALEAVGGAVGRFEGADDVVSAWIAAAASRGLCGAARGCGAGGVDEVGGAAGLRKEAQGEGGEQEATQEVGEDGLTQGQREEWGRCWARLLLDVFGVDLALVRAGGARLPLGARVGKEAFAGLTWAQRLTVVAGVYEVKGREGSVGGLGALVKVLRAKMSEGRLVVREWGADECELLLEGRSFVQAIEEAQEAAREQEAAGLAQEIQAQQAQEEARLAQERAARSARLAAEGVSAQDQKREALRAIAELEQVFASKARERQEAAARYEQTQWLKLRCVGLLDALAWRDPDAVSVMQTLGGLLDLSAQLEEAALAADLWQDGRGRALLICEALAPYRQPSAVAAMMGKR